MEDENKATSNEIVEEEKKDVPEEKAENDVKEATEATEEQAPVKEMKCVVLSSFGGLKAIKIQNKPEPTPGEGEVLIRVKSCGLNFLDVMLRQGIIDSPPKLPIIMGYECAGEVEAVGEGVPDVQVGDRVAALTDCKSWAELVVVNTKYIYKLPQEMTFQDASAMLMNYVVAYGLVFDTACIRENQTVLIHSAGGGVGLAIAQLIKTIPNITLIGVASKHKHEAIKNYYAHLIERGTDYVQEVKKLAPSGVDIVLDCLCGEDSNKGYGLLKPMGRYILYGNSSIVTGETKSIFSVAKSWWQVDKLKPMKLFDENRSVSGFHLRHLLYKQNGHDYVRNAVEKIFKLWLDGQIKPIIDSTYAFEDIPEAMQHLHERKNIGKITIDPAMEPKPKPVVESKKRKDSVKTDKKSEDGKAQKTENKTQKNEEEKTEDDKDAPADAS
ncbi:synaptic vesicle membrane protein VAT-1 homolog-like [Trichonephila inaurata madagascariensis]|uniref:Synaptic vesicle membrane protein VAT-1 homolog-like n=1 Tax=Trichonephila inaurata madagascariensis TaxID=2747483 RepID=A0A8X7BWF2_9ARAC|nr:synaptic vesicle membrane protein VAT-1 homolog-like [Trichonephila inaurata madagascariensis]